MLIKNDDCRVSWDSFKQVIFCSIDVLVFLVSCFFPALKNVAGHFPLTKQRDKAISRNNVAIVMISS